MKPYSQIPPPEFLQLFGSKKAPTTKKRETIIPAPSYNIPAVLLGGAGLAHFAFSNDIAAGLSGILGVFLTIQASRVKFIFGPDDLEVRIGEQKEKSENAFVGGENKWSYDTFVNWYGIIYILFPPLFCSTSKTCFPYHHFLLYI